MRPCPGSQQFRYSSKGAPSSSQPAGISDALVADFGLRFFTRTRRQIEYGRAVICVRLDVYLDMLLSRAHLNRNETPNPNSKAPRNPARFFFFLSLYAPAYIASSSRHHQPAKAETQNVFVCVLKSYSRSSNASTNTGSNGVVLWRCAGI